MSHSVIEVSFFSGNQVEIHHNNLSFPRCYAGTHISVLKRACCFSAIWQLSHTQSLYPPCCILVWFPGHVTTERSLLDCFFNLYVCVE